MTALGNPRGSIVRRMLLGLTVAAVLGLVVLMIGHTRGRRAAHADHDLWQLEKQVVDKTVLADNLGTIRAEFERLRDRGAGWPVRADARLLRRLRRALPGASVVIEDDRGDSASVRVRVPGGRERLEELVAALQSANLSIVAVRAVGGEIEAVGSLLDTVVALSNARARLEPAEPRLPEDSLFDFDLFGSELQRIEARRVEVRAELDRLDAVLGPLAFIASLKVELNDRQRALDVLERHAKRPLTAAQLRAFDRSLASAAATAAPAQK